MNESEFQTKFDLWSKYNLGGINSCELKVTKTNTFNFNRIEPHQIRNLLLWKAGTFVYKISDESRGQKPFDSININCGKGVLQSYLVLMFWKKGVNHFYIIDIDNIIIEMKTKKSINEIRAGEICMIRGVLK